MSYQDGVLDIGGAVLSMQVIAGMTPAQSVPAVACIVGDGRIGLADVIHILPDVAGMRGQNCSHWGSVN